MKFTRPVLFLIVASTLFAQKNAAIPRLADGHPNLQGVWEHPYVPDMSKDGKDQKGAGELPFNEAGAENFKTYDVSKFDYTGHCLPFGLLRSINVGGYPIQIMQNDEYLAFLFEQNTWFNVVYMDGRAHPKNLDPTWFGHSIGKWDGDTLVIDTVALRDNTFIEGFTPHSEAMTVHERMRFIAPDVFEDKVTVADPKALTQPWEHTFLLRKAKAGADEMREAVCPEGLAEAK
jgi:hypothetical protein